MLKTRSPIIAWIMLAIQNAWLMLVRICCFFTRDIPSVLYDFEDYDSPAYLSLPRLAYFVSGSMLVIAYVREHFFGIVFIHWVEIIAFFSACSAGYMGKKFAERK